MRKKNRPERILLVVGRDDWVKGEYMTRMALGGLVGLGFKIAWEDPGLKWLFWLRRIEAFFPELPKRIRSRYLKSILFLYGITHWHYFAERKRRNASFEYRIESLRHRLGRIRAGSEVHILAYSSGARIASLLVDRYPIKRLICIGYPFRNRKEGDNPDRYRHLAGLRTPMLIIQGRRDEYGGDEASRTYTLSPAIEFFLIDSDHKYRLDEGQWGSVLAKIRSVSETPAAPREEPFIASPWARAAVF